MNSILRNGPLFAVIAHGLIGITLVWDKVLLKRPGTKNLFSYVFWLGSLSVFGVVLVPFGYKPASLGLTSIAFFAGLIHLLAIFFYHKALKRGEASETLAIMGGFSPVATALIALALLSKHMTGEQLIGFAIMTAGGFVMFFSEKLPLKKLLVPVALASGLFGLVNVLEKVVYNHTNFVTGYVWFTIGTFAGAMALLIRRSWRAQIFAGPGQAEQSLLVFCEPVYFWRRILPDFLRHQFDASGCCLRDRGRAIRGYLCWRASIDEGQAAMAERGLSRLATDNESCGNRPGDSWGSACRDERQRPRQRRDLSTSCCG